MGKLIFIDAGTYILTSTVVIPSGSKLVGEAWSQFAATGSYFNDASNPKVMLRVGNPGDVGDLEMQDLLFTTQGPTAGAILVEWNIKARLPGSAALWGKYLPSCLLSLMHYQRASCFAIVADEIIQTAMLVLEGQ